MKRILIVDDDAELRDMLCATLSEAGYEVATAADGTEASAILRTKRPEIVITDVYMPSKDGLEILLDLRQHFPDIKVIAMSGGKRKYLGSIQGVGGLLHAGQAIRTCGTPASRRASRQGVEGNRPVCGRESPFRPRCSLLPQTKGPGAANGDVAEPEWFMAVQGSHLCLSKSRISV